MSAHFLAIDLGAESGRVMRGRLCTGVLTLDELCRFPNAPIRDNGSLHWDIRRLWSEIQQGLDRSADRRPQSVGIDTWGCDYALLDARGNLVEQPYHYRDVRTTGVMEAVWQRVSREDQYMTEGVTHVQKRNELLAASDPRSAWMENQILEKYFAPVLDTPSYVSRRGHRWSPEQRQSVEAQAAGGNPGYVSRANPYPIYAWSRALFWLVSICIAGVIWIGASIVERSRRVG